LIWYNVKYSETIALRKSKMFRPRTVMSRLLIPTDKKFGNP